MSGLRAAGALVAAAVLCATVGASVAHGGGTLAERQKAKRFVPVAHTYIHRAGPLTTSVRLRVGGEANACDVSAPQASAEDEASLESFAVALLVEKRLVPLYEATRAKLVVLRPRARSLRTLASASGIQLREARKFSSMSDVDFCSILHLWQARQWSHAYPSAYYHRVLRARGIDFALMLREHRRTYQARSGLRKLGLSPDAAINVVAALEFPA